MYEMNTHPDFTVKLAQDVDLVSTSNWEMGLCEISCSSSPHMEQDDTVVTYCNLISPQFVADSTVRSMRTFVFSSSSSSSPCQHEFQNVYYVPVEQQRYQDVRIEFLTTEGLHTPFEDSTKPTMWCFIFERIRRVKKCIKPRRREL